MKLEGLDYGDEPMRLRVDVLCPLLGIVLGIAVACSSQERTPNSGESPAGDSAAVIVLKDSSSK